MTIRRSRFPAQVLPPAVTAGSGLPQQPVPVPGSAPLHAAAGGVRPGAQPSGSSSRPMATPLLEAISASSQAGARVRMVTRLKSLPHMHREVLRAMGEVPRHAFIDSALVAKAYEENSLPIGYGQTISRPSVVARMLSLVMQACSRGAARVPGRVLEIGTGCGYQAAVMSRLALEVYSIERVRGLHDRARTNLRPLRVANLHLLFGDGMQGYVQGAPYSAIVSAAGGEAVPDAWLEQLALGGRIVAPTVVAGGRQVLMVIDRTTTGFRRQALDAVHFVPLESGIG